MDNLLEQIKDFKKCVKSDNSDYLTGYLSALSAVEGMIAAQNDGWISVTDEMPRLGQRVMAFCRAGILTFLRYDGEVWFEMSSKNKYLLRFVTHWRPIPEPPKEDEDETD